MATPTSVQPPWCYHTCSSSLQSARGAVVGLLVSIPDAIITKAWAPILIVGVIGGAIIGWLAVKWAA